MVREFEELRWAKEVGPQESFHRPFFAKGVRIAFWSVLLVVAGSTTTALMPQYEAMKEREAALAATEERERQALMNLRRYQLEASELKTNSQYLETRARDVLFLQRPGETVVQLPQKN